MRWPHLQHLALFPLLLATVVVAACAGDPGGTPNSSKCDGRNLKSYDANGDESSKVLCPLTCEVDHCTAASSIPAEMQSACTDAAPEFNAVDGGEIEPDLELACLGCGGAKIQPTRIEAGDVDLAFYCLSSFTIPAGKTLTVAKGLDTAIVIFVAGNLFIDGILDIAGDTQAPGAGGSAGGAAAAEGTSGNLGLGSCGGLGGATTTNNATINIGAGGGGGGYRTAGAAGGPARDAAMQMAAAGAGGPVCATDTLKPLIGGAGGGGGGDGICTGALAATCGRPGGGGGGAIQLVATGTVTVRAPGQIKASGGVGGTIGPGDEGGGTGGGGAGGSILIEGGKVSLTGMLDVRGGDGGANSTNLGGLGGTPTAMPLPGTNPLIQPTGGSGGGGASGWVRINANVGANCPHASCSSGPLEAAP